MLNPTKNPLPLKREGVEVNLASAPTSLPEGSILRMMRDQILVRVTEWKGSATLWTAWNGRPLRGVAVTVGNGCYPWRYNANRSKRWQSKAFRKCDVKAGDIVELGGLEMRGYPFQEILIGNVPHVIVREEDIVMVVSP